MKAAAAPRPSHMPPAATTGMSSASTTCGTRGMVCSSPTCPPDSAPSATTASAPAACILRASATDATTGMTLMPASFHIGMYLAGDPAPVVRIFTPSSTTICAISSALGAWSMMFTPKGLSVSSRHSLISALTASVPALIDDIRPSPPALDTAAARDASATQAIPP